MKRCILSRKTETLYYSNRETEEELLPSCHPAPKLILSLITFTWLNLRNCKTFTILHHPYCCMYSTYPVQPVCTCFLHMFILLFISPQYTVLQHFILLHIYSLFFLLFLFYFYLYFIYNLLCCYIFALSTERTWTWFTFHYWLYPV